MDRAFSNLSTTEMSMWTTNSNDFKSNVTMSSTDQLVNLIKDTLDECNKKDALDCANKIAKVLIERQLLMSTKTPNIQYMLMINNGTIMTTNDNDDAKVSAIVSRVFDIFMEKFNGSMNESLPHQMWITTLTTVSTHINSVSTSRSKIPWPFSSTAATTSTTTSTLTMKSSPLLPSTLTSIDDGNDQKKSTFFYSDTFNDDLDILGVQPNLCDLLNSYRIPRMKK
ncbi:uncharacterized protein LOC126897689 [Daktulosphaira vitifoliae]|uniref:uncharacterized protein LOC126897689 n=1 Tax=Daktulosphaira vitifoliae TaxID=58002 RepID=UPI0021A9CD2E|nr:uncharacterized protein LOC126897689 [Daktulosphaira vitifoliae]